MSLINLFDTEIPVRDFICCEEEGSQIPAEPYINLFIKLTNNCIAKCGFCTYRNNTPDIFDYDKLLDVIAKVTEKVPIHKVNFTGGEPTLSLDLFCKTVKKVRELLPNSYITINTNGVRLTQLGRKLPEKAVDSYALSRHHYRDYENSRIFGTNEVATNEDIKKFPYKDRLHLRCNLIKGYIDGITDIKKYINYYADECGVYNTYGFVSLWNLNKFCEENKVDANQIDLKSLGRTYSPRIKYKPNGMCSCRNFVYATPKGNLATIYTREDKDVSDQVSILIYDVDKVRPTFSGPAIY